MSGAIVKYGLRSMQRSIAMRVLTTFLLLALLTAGVAAGQASTTSAPAGAAPCAADASGGIANATVREWRRDCAENMTLYRRLSIESFNENKTLAIVQHEVNLTHIRATFMDGKLQAFEACRDAAAGYGRTEKGPHDGVFASCMKDKMKTLRDAATASQKAERPNLLAGIDAAKAGAKAQFAAQRDAWLAAHPKP